MADQYDGGYSSPEAVRLAKSLAAARTSDRAPSGAYRRATTPQSLSQSAFYPEDENRAAELERVKNDNWLNWYNENLGPDAIHKLAYEGAKQQGWDEDRAIRYADHIRSKAVRGEHLMMDAPLAGAVLGVGTEAYNTARSVMTGTRAAETAAPRVLALPAPRPGPSSPVGRGLSDEPIPLGRPPVNPATDYRLSSEQGQRIGPNRPSEALRPEVDQMYSPTGRNEFAPNVSTRSRLTQLGDESPMQAERAGLARQSAQEAEDAFRARQAAIAEEEGFGRPMTQSEKDFAQFQRELSLADRGANVPFEPPASAGAPRSPFLDMPVPGVRARPVPPAPEPLQLGSSGSASGTLVDPLTGQAYRPRQMPSLSQAGTGSFSPVTRAEAVIPHRPVNIEELLKKQPVSEAKGALSAEEIELIRKNYPELAAELDVALAQRAQPSAATAADFEVGPWGARPKTESRGLPPGSTVMPPPPVGPATVASAPPILAREAPIGSILGYGGLGTGATIMAALSKGPSATPRRPMSAADVDSITAGYDTGGPDVFQQAAAERARNMYAVDDLDQANDARMRAAQRMRDIDDADRRRDMPSSASRATSTARTVLSSPPTGASAPTGTKAESRGFLSGLIGSGGKLFDTDYQKGATSRQMYETASRDPENQGAYWRAVQRQKEEAASGSAPQAEKRGGEVEQKPTKEAMLHKSLEIIHHMIRNR